MLNSSVFKFALLSFLILMAFAAAAGYAWGQSPPAASDPDRGFTEFESLQSTLNSQEHLFKIDSNAGWDFNSHFGMFGGIPVYLVDVPSSSTTAGGVKTTTPGTSHNGLGNAYLGMAYRAPSPKLGYATVLTVWAPTASAKDGLSTGRATVDWDNRLQHSFTRLTPFFDGGIGNSVPDSTLFARPFTSLGFIAHLEEGAGYKLTHRFSVNASAYQIVPEGNQKIFSKLVAKGQPGNPNGKNSFQTAATASGTDLTRENGYSAWFDFQPASIWDLAVGYTRSQTFGLNSLAFNLRMNVGKLLRNHRTS